MEEVGLWRKGFKEKVSFEFRVEKSRSGGQKNAPLTMPNNHFTDLLMPFLGKSVELPQKRSYSNW